MTNIFYLQVGGKKLSGIDMKQSYFTVTLYAYTITSDQSTKASAHE